MLDLGSDPTGSSFEGGFGAIFTVRTIIRDVSGFPDRMQLLFKGQRFAVFLMHFLGQGLHKGLWFWVPSEWGSQAGMLNGPWYPDRPCSMVSENQRVWGLQHPKMETPQITDAFGKPWPNGQWK